MRRPIAAALLLVFALCVHAASPASADPALARRVEDLSQALRCLVCQN